MRGVALKKETLILHQLRQSATRVPEKTNPWVGRSLVPYTMES